jgi:hypothetical protein
MYLLRLSKSPGFSAPQHHKRVVDENNCIVLRVPASQREFRRAGGKKSKDLCSALPP